MHSTRTAPQHHSTGAYSGEAHIRTSPVSATWTGGPS